MSRAVPPKCNFILASNIIASVKLLLSSEFSKNLEQNEIARASRTREKH